MSAARDAFLKGLVDYAGLFPPAALDITAAVTEYARHRTEPEAWMLGRFIAPAGRLADVVAAAEPHLAAASPWDFSVLVGDRTGAEAFDAALPGQAAAIRAVEEGQPGRVTVGALEAPLPLDAPEPWVAGLSATLGDLGLAGRELFLEILPGADDDATVAAIAGAASVHDVRLGAKLRCGGVTADAFPTPQRVAAVINACARRDLPLKCTAGLHHPVRHRATEPDVMMHGFLNVFGAALLAWQGEDDLAVLEACVAETEAEAFAFSTGAFTWRDRTVPAAAIDRFRTGHLCGFGSCSFAEPRADLQALGML